jgi:hypothetical protein
MPDKVWVPNVVKIEIEPKSEMQRMVALLLERGVLNASARSGGSALVRALAYMEVKRQAQELGYPGTQPVAEIMVPAQEPRRTRAKKTKPGS